MIRRRCANAFAQTSNGHTSGIERIATAILSKSEKDCLVPSRIAAELTPKLRTYLGIVPLDTEGLEGLLEKHRNAIAQLEPTASEREAFLRTQLSDSLLRRLPIHVRSDGAIGDAENVFREADWPIPATLREHVPTIQLCSNPVARERQQRLITVWSPQSQLEIALSQTEPHRLRIDILDALAKLAAEKSEPELRLCQALRTTPWLAADERPIAPQDVLALPPSVDEAARALLIRSGQAVQFLPVRKLAIDVREHPGFVHLEKWILPDQASSFAALALMIEDSAIIGRLGESYDYPINDFTALAAWRRSETAGMAAIGGCPKLPQRRSLRYFGDHRSLCWSRRFRRRFGSKSPRQSGSAGRGKWTNGRSRATSVSPRIWRRR
jgi:hypothetical protein